MGTTLSKLNKYYSSSVMFEVLFHTSYEKPIRAVWSRIELCFRSIAEAQPE